MKHFLKLSAISALALICLFTSCSSNNAPGEEDNERKSISLTQEEVSQVSSLNDFAFEFFTKYSNHQNDLSNKIYSPLCLSVNLSMAANGATGETHSEILKALKATDINAINSLNHKLLQQLPSLDKKSEVCLANSAWLDNEFTVKSGFVNLLSEQYLADCQNVNMNSNTSKDLINSWCSKKTNNIISNLLTEPNGGKLSLISATYFNGQWKTPFEKKNTHNGLFNNIDGSKSTVEMMYNEFTSTVVYTPQFEIFSLPYGNGAFYMTLYLPKSDLSISEAIENFNFSDRSLWTQLYCKVNLTLPKFSIESDGEQTMIEILRQLGINKAFDSSAEFGNISEKPLSITSVRQVATISVDENKTVASSISKIDFGETALPIEGIVDFKLDRPFLFTIQEYSTGIILYMGTVVKL